nr:hypothetical protein [Tanacetum cinerariifolium]
MIDNQVDDLTSHNTKYSSPTLTQKVFANTRRVGKGFSGVETHLFTSMMVPPQPQAAEVEEEVEVPTTPAPPSPTNAPSHDPQDLIPTPAQAQRASPSSSTQEQPTETSKSSIPLLNTLLEKCDTLPQKVAEFEQDKHTQASEIINLNKRVKNLEKKNKSRRMHPNRGKIVEINADEDITLVDVETQVDMNAELQGRIDDMKAENERLLDEQIAKRLHDEEVEQVAAREKQEKDDLERAKVLKQEYDDKQENTDWNMEHLRGMTYDKVRPIFKREYNKVQTLFKPDKDVKERTKKTVAKETLLQESFKKLKAVEVSGSESTQETPTNDPKEMSEEDVQNMLEIIPVSEFKSFEYMVKGFDREDLVALWRLVKYKFSLAVPNVDKEKALWVELKRLFEPDTYDVLWKLQRYMHYPITWMLYSNYGVHQVSSTTRRHDMFMLTEKNYPLSNGVMTLMLSAKLQVEKDSDMARDLVMKIFMEANKPKSRSLDTSFE